MVGPPLSVKNARDCTGRCRAQGHASFEVKLSRLNAAHLLLFRRA
jgi:hypothetical protein